MNVRDIPFYIISISMLGMTNKFWEELTVVTLLHTVQSIQRGRQSCKLTIKQTDVSNLYIPLQ